MLCIVGAWIRVCYFIVGEFGSERLVQQVVDTILAQSATLIKQDDKNEELSVASGSDNDVWSAETASKIILTGPKV